MPAKSVTFTAQWTENAYTVLGNVVDDKKDVVSDATVKLMKGNIQTGTTATTDTDGKFTISNVPNGTYNLVVSKDGIIVTTIIVVSSADKATGTIMLPSGKTNSVVEVMANTPQIVVGNLENQFNADDKDVATSGGSVEIKLIAEAKNNTATNASDISATASSDGKTIGQFIDLSVLKTVKTTAGVANSTYLKELPTLIEVFIPLDTALQGKSDYVIYRYHDTGVDTITTSPNADGEKIEMIDSNTIKLTIKKFSTYAIAYKDTSAGGGTTGGTTGADSENNSPVIAQPIETMPKDAENPIVKPAPIKPTKNPVTGHNVPITPLCVVPVIWLYFIGTSQKQKIKVTKKVK